MFKVEMSPTMADVMSLVTGRLTVDDDKQSEWLDRGRQQFLTQFEILRKVGPDFRERVFPSVDQTPETIRKATYRVEARRSLLRALDELVLLVLIVVGLLGAAMAAYVDLVLGITVSMIGATISARLRHVGVRRARELVPWRQGSEPLAWALYYPCQKAQQILMADDALKAAGDTSIAQRLEALQSGVERGPDGAALPGQEGELNALVHYMVEDVPLLLSSTDSSRSLARMVSDRAAGAAELVRGELAQQLGGKSGWLRGASSRLSEIFAERAYSYLMGQADSLAMLPRRERDVPSVEEPVRSLAQDESFVALVSKGKELVAAAEKAATGYWPAETSPRWKRPKNNRWAIVGASIGAGLVAAGFLLTFHSGTPALGQTLIGIGAVLLPGTAGKVLKEAGALRTSI